MKKIKAMMVLIIMTQVSPLAFAGKEVALTFDDAPRGDTGYYQSIDRTKDLILKLKKLKVPSAMIFANPCRGKEPKKNIEQLRLYKDAGYLLGNHTCSHPRLDKVGFKKFTSDTLKADRLLSPFFVGQKFFRYPFLNEGNDVKLRDRVRVWLKKQNYRNASITGDNEDPTFTKKMNDAKKAEKSFDLVKVKKLFLDHIISSLECNDKLALSTIGRSPKHTLLLHEVDATVMFIEDLVKELRKRGWKIIDPIEAYRDPIYKLEPKSTYSGFGLISQLAHEKTGLKNKCYDYKKMVQKLNKILKL